jgi:hypothetical protein
MRDTSLWNMAFKYADMAGKIRERYALSIIPMLLIPNYLPLRYFPVATLGELDPKVSCFKKAQQTVATDLESFSGPF